MHATAAAERISRRFPDEDVGRSLHRLEIVRRDREAAPERPVDTPARPSSFARPFASDRRAGWAPVPASSQSAAVEQYRRLAAALIRAHAEHDARVFMLTSSVAGEGKSLTTANLAVTLARSYRRETLVIDADQRDPSQHVIFNVDNRRGLTEFLHTMTDEPASTVELFPGLTLLPAGRPTSDPMGGLTSRRMTRLLADAAGTFDFVLLDTPPVTLVPDAELLAPLADAAVLVVQANRTPFDAVERAVATLGRDRILGTVLNQADPASVGRYGYGYGYPRR